MFYCFLFDFYGISWVFIDVCFRINGFNWVCYWFLVDVGGFWYIEVVFKIAFNGCSVGFCLILVVSDGFLVVLHGM